LAENRKGNSLTCLLLQVIRDTQFELPIYSKFNYNRAYQINMISLSSQFVYEL